MGIFQGKMKFFIEKIAGKREMNVILPGNEDPNLKILHGEGIFRKGVMEILECESGWSMTEKRIINTTSGEEAEGMRLDLFLAERFTYRSRSQWQKAVERGEILIGNSPVRPSRKLRNGEKISFIPPDEVLKEPDVDLFYTPLWEEGEYFAVAKPGNLPVHPAGRFFEHTLLTLLRKDRGEVFIVNRLDRETSGIVLGAASGKSAAILSEQFATRKVTKKYLAIVRGVFPEKELFTEGYLGQDWKSPVNKKRKYFPGKKEPAASSRSGPFESCATEFRLLGENGKCSLVEVTPHSGRLHQIRAVLLSLGTPLVGDKLYGGRDEIYLSYLKGSLSREEEEYLILSRQALHAWKLNFFLPGKEEKTQISLKAPLPEDLFHLYSSITDAIL